MYFNLAFCNHTDLAEAQRRGPRAYWPHLRLVSLIPAETLAPALAELSPHINAVVRSYTPSTPVNAILRSAATDNLRLPQGLPVLDWGGVDAAYQTWMHQVYLPHQRQICPYDPQGLRPADEPPEDLDLEVVGSCAAQFMVRYVHAVAEQLETTINVQHIVHNHPVPVMRSGRTPDIQIMMPPLRYMHPSTLDNFITWEDHDLKFDETVVHLYSYLDTATSGLPCSQRYIVNFPEPFSNPLGYGLGHHSLSNFKYFVSKLNEALGEWCETQKNTWVVDANELSALVGRSRSDEELLNFYGHRIAFDPYDDWIEADHPLSPYPVIESFQMDTGLFYSTLLRHVLARRITLLGRSPVKLVITDLDNTLWRGVAAEGSLGEWTGRPMAYIESLRILKKRGILLAIASKNDDRFIRSNWKQFMLSGNEPLGMNISLDEFVMTRINFHPKPDNVREILAATNILPENTVFIDDNPLEREAVQAAFPQIRTLGAELNYLRRELLYSPYTQRAVLTEEDHRRTELMRTRVSLFETVQQGGAAGDFLAHLDLSLRVGLSREVGSPTMVRCVQLINKTNQWNLNGRRIAPDELQTSLDRDHVLVWGEVADTNGSYGIVAAAVVHPKTAIVTHLVVSCRVIGMGVDEAFVSQLCNAFGLLRLDFAPTERNLAAQSFMSNCDPDGYFRPSDALSHIQVDQPLVLEAFT